MDGPNLRYRIGVLDLAPLLDRILDGIPDRADRLDVYLFPCGLAQIVILLGHVEKLHTHRRPWPAVKGFQLVQVEVRPFRCERVLGLGLPGDPPTEHLHRHVELNYAVKAGQSPEYRRSRCSFSSVSWVTVSASAPIFFASVMRRQIGISSISSSFATCLAASGCLAETAAKVGASEDVEVWGLDLISAHEPALLPHGRGSIPCARKTKTPSNRRASSIGDIDRQRVAAVKTLQELGLIWSQGAWQKVPQGEFVAEADAMHAMLVRRADALEGCLEGSAEEAELEAIADVLGAYEAKRWPLGRMPGGKG
jgi:hypothetical protein